MNFMPQFRVYTCPLASIQISVPWALAQADASQDGYEPLPAPPVGNAPVGNGPGNPPVGEAPPVPVGPTTTPLVLLIEIVGKPDDVPAVPRGTLADGVAPVLSGTLLDNGAVPAGAVPVGTLPDGALPEGAPPDGDGCELGQ